MKSIKLQKTQSLLMELIPEALSQLNDNRINSLTILAVDCKHGKYDATVYFDKTNMTEDELKEVKIQLKKINGTLKAYCLRATSWYKCPDFKFVADDFVQREANLEKLFKQI